jgi:hypothetical protein
VVVLLSVEILQGRKKVAAAGRRNSELGFGGGAVQA